MPFKPGEQVGPYRIMEKLGRGGMATVFKAYHANLDRYVAIKVLHPAFMEDPNFLARFEREAKVVAMLEHPHIIPVYDFAENEGRTYLVMKFVEGETLKASLNKKPLTPEEGVQVIEAMGEALSYAHREGILHRDVKPSNVMMADDGKIFLTDFGLARIASAGESTLSSDMMIGTPQYISPEQAMGKRDLDEGTDIYSFGVLIYELVVGQVPFISDTPFSIIHDHIYTPLPLPRSVNPNVPEVIERLLLKALTKEREHRFKTIDEMVAAFKLAIGGEPLPDTWVDPATYTPPDAISAAFPTPPPTQTLETPQPGTGKPRRRRWWLPIPIVLGLCLVVFIAISILNQDEPAQQPTPPPDTIVEATEAPKPPPPTRSIQEDPNLQAALDEALGRVENNPDDPTAHLELAMAYLDMRMPSEAEEEFALGEELSGGDPEYYMVAGDMLVSREMWLPALEQYFKILQMDTGEEDPGFQEKFRQTLYHAADNPNAEELLFGSDPNDFGPLYARLLIPTARARFTLFHRYPEEALRIINLVIENDTKSP
ncbi:MAG: serine/threonine protein kinase, partial [Anaerolineales bacterium]